jgi:hypothetical protein
MDLFKKIQDNRGPLGQHAKDAHGYFTFPKLEGDISSRMTFNNKEVICWSINNYLGYQIIQKLGKLTLKLLKNGDLELLWVQE